LYLRFVNFSYFGADGDVFGNVLANLFGFAGDSRAESILQILDATQVAEPYPVRVVTNPIARSDPMWRAYMGRHRQNLMRTRRAYAVALSLERLGVARRRIELEARGGPRDTRRLTHAKSAQRRPAELFYVSTDVDAAQIRMAQSETKMARRDRSSRTSLRIVARNRLH
jgi:hypothetical protein